MTEWHPKADRLERFMRGELDAGDSQEIVIHLLSGCEPCRRIARESFPCTQPVLSSADANAVRQWQARTEDSYAAVFEQVVPRVWESEAALADQRVAAPALLEELKRHPHERRLLLVRNSQRFRSWPLCELVIDTAFKLGFQDPSSSVEYGHLAVELTGRIGPDLSSAELVYDLRCRAHGILGNALRISGDLAGAAGHFRLAEDCLSRGTGDALEHARLLELESYLAGEHRDFSQAFECLDHAIRIYRRQGDDHRLGRTMIIKGHQLGEKGEILAAIASLRQGLRYIDGEREPRLALVAKHNLVRHLFQIGRYHQAISLLPETRRLHTQLGNEMDLARFDWLEGMILRDSGDMQAAETALTRVKRFFVDRGIAHDTALVSLDLAVIYHRQHRTTELKELAGEMLTIFHALRVHREAIAALVLFQKAVEMERVTLGLVRDLTAYLKNSRHDPHLPFRPSLQA